MHEKNIVRTPSREFASEGYNLIAPGMWAKPIPGQVLLRRQCALCRTISEQEPVDRLSEGMTINFECPCGTKSKLIIPETAKVIELKSKDSDHLNSLHSLISNGKGGVLKRVNQ